MPQDQVPSRTIQPLRSRAFVANKITRALPNQVATAEKEKEVRAKSPDPRRKVEDLTEGHWYTWVLAWLKATFGHWTKHALPPLSGAPNSAIYSLPDKCLIGIAADWGSGTTPAIRVAEGIRSLDPDVTIHMGDVYFAGEAEEYRDIFVGNPPETDGSWPRGKRQPQGPNDALPSYALNGNHEMYSGGFGYFDGALKALRQKTSYFALENQHWRIVALDTGYTTPRNGVAQLFTDLLFRMSNGLTDENVNWLKQHVFADPQDKRPVILLSHHQPFSAFERDYPKLVGQVGEYLDRVVLWFWGHEHKLALFAAAPVSGSKFKVRGRCIGHGGMPSAPKFSPTRDPGRKYLVVTPVEGRGLPDESASKTVYSYCGWITLNLEGPELRVRYYEEDPNQSPAEPLLEEVWTTDDGGACKGRIEGSLNQTSLVVRSPHSLADLVQ